MADRGTERVRERAIGRLQRGYVCGSVGTQTFEHRVQAAWSSDAPSVLRRLTSDRVVITDLGSTNGTSVNGRWISQAEVLPGDKLQLGRLDLVL